MSRLVLALMAAGVLLGGCGGDNPSSIGPTGSCCTSGGSCTVTTAAHCPGVWTEAGACDPNACPPADLVLVPAGTFTMGSPADEPDRSSDEAQHRVTLTKSFYLCDHEVTQSEWNEVMDTWPARFGDNDSPVETVTWLECIDYCNARSVRENLQPVYAWDSTGVTVTWDRSRDGYRLPTEAEWEYASRAGTQTAFWNGAVTSARCSPLDPVLDRVGWYCGNASGSTHHGGGKAANAWGLHDMHGNVWEWCWDWFGAYETEGTDPAGPASGSLRVMRGGSWSYHARYCRSAQRFSVAPNQAYSVLGLRVARNAR